MSALPPTSKECKERKGKKRWAFRAVNRLSQNMAKEKKKKRKHSNRQARARISSGGLSAQAQGKKKEGQKENARSSVSSVRSRGTTGPHRTPCRCHATAGTPSGPAGRAGRAARRSWRARAGPGPRWPSSPRRRPGSAACPRRSPSAASPAPNPTPGGAPCRVAASSSSSAFPAPARLRRRRLVCLLESSCARRATRRWRRDGGPCQWKVPWWDFAHPCFFPQGALPLTKGRHKESTYPTRSDKFSTWFWL